MSSNCTKLVVLQKQQLCICGVLAHLFLHEVSHLQLQSTSPTLHYEP